MFIMEMHPVVLSTAFELAESRHSLDDLRSKTVTCKLVSPGNIRFIGDIDQLSDCLDKIEKIKVRTLTITSGGGDVAKSLAVARRLALMKINLRVSGTCASSCANYIVPVSRSVIILPYSILGLHGAIDSSFLVSSEAQLRAALASTVPPPSPEETEAIVGSEMSKLRAIQVDQDQFQKEFHVSDDWYALKAYKDLDVETPADKKPMVAVSEKFFRSNLKVKLAHSSWWIKNMSDYDLVQSLFTKTVIIYKYDS